MFSVLDSRSRCAHAGSSPRFDHFTVFLNKTFTAPPTTTSISGYQYFKNKETIFEPLTPPRRIMGHRMENIGPQRVQSTVTIRDTFYFLSSFYNRVTC